MDRLNDEKNLAFMNDPRRVAAQKELDSIVHHISASLQSQWNAQYYLTVLPPLLKRLETAYENLTIVETTILSELEERAE